MDSKQPILDISHEAKLIYLEKEIKQAREEMLNFRHRKKKIPTVVIHKKVVVTFD